MGNGPAVAFLDNNNALALWTSNDGPKSLTELSSIFSHQDIRYSFWNGDTWSAPAWLTKDAAADGMADVSYNASARQAVAVWFHDPNFDNDLETRSEWDIFAAVYDQPTASWNVPVNLSGPDSAADYMPKVASGGAVTMAVWAHDGDKKFTTVLYPPVNGTNVSYDNADGSIYFSLYENNQWSQPAMVPGLMEGFVSWPTVGIATDGGKALVAWAVKKNSPSEGDVLSILRYAIYDATGETCSAVTDIATGAATWTAIWRSPWPTPSLPCKFW